MSKVAQYLQEHLIGEVMTATDAREYFSTDASIFKVAPQIIAYPRAENDVRKAARFTWQLAERGRALSLTARGLGTDLTGAAIGSGIILVFPAHMNKILAVDSSKGSVTVQPGLLYGKLQQTLQTHGMHIPPAPASLEYSTIGGAISNNAAGEKSVKYGVTKDYVKQLRVVLANGELITVGRLSKRELSHKMGLATLEGEIYRTIDAIVKDNKDLLDSTEPRVLKNNAGYDLWNIYKKDGSVDLTPLFVGAQGTLGIVTEATLGIQSYNPKTTVMVGYFEDLDKVGKAIDEIRKLQPCALEIVDDNLLKFIKTHNPSQLKDINTDQLPRFVLITEFDDANNRQQKKRVKKATKVFKKHALDHKVATDEHEQQNIWKIRSSTATILSQGIGYKKSLPIIEDASVPTEYFAELIIRAKKLFKQFELDVAMWGDAGNANLHVQPFFDLDQVGDRQKIFKLMNAYYTMVIEMGGSISSQHNDGRLRGPFLAQQFGPEIYELFKKVKQAFDPYNTLNPGVKINVTLQDIQPLLRQEYSVKHLYHHLPRI